MYYEYRCKKCGEKVTLKRAIAERDCPVDCPSCLEACERLLMTGQYFCFHGALSDDDIERWRHKHLG